MKRFTKKVITIVLAGTLSLGMLTGCGSDKLDGTKTVATVDGVEIPMGVLSLSARMTQSYYSYLYSMFGSSMSWSATDEESGQTNGESLRDSILENVERQYVLKAKAADYGITLSDEDKEKIKAAAAAFIADNTDETIEALGVNEDIVAQYLELQTYVTRIEDPVREEADTTVNEEEAQQASFTYVSIAKDVEEEDAASEEETTAEAVTTAEGEAAAEAVTTAEGEAAAEAETAAEAVTTAEAEAAEQTEAAVEAETAAEAATTEAEAAAQTEAAAEAETAAEAVTTAEAEAEAQIEGTLEAETAAEAVTTAEAEAATEGETTQDTAEEGPSYTAAEKAQMTLDIMKADPEGDWTEALSAIDEGLSVLSDSFTYPETEDEHLANTFDEEVITVLKTLADGEVYDGIIETDDTYYLVRLDSMNDEEATQAKIEEVQEELKDEHFSETTAAWVDAAEIKVNQKVLKTLEISDYHTFTTTQGTEEETAEADIEEVTEADSEMTQGAEESGEAVTEVAAEAVTAEAAEAVTESEAAAVNEAVEPAAAPETTAEAVTEAVTE